MRPRHSPVVMGLLVTFVRQSGNASLSLAVGVNGTFTVTSGEMDESGGEVDQTARYSLSVVETSPQNSSDSVSADWTTSYLIPVALSQLTEADPLPAGTFTLAGTEVFVMNSVPYSFVLTTPTALTIDPACATSVTGGAVNMTFDVAGTVTIAWSACGTYSITHR